MIAGNDCLGLSQSVDAVLVIIDNSLDIAAVLYLSNISLTRIIAEAFEIRRFSSTSTSIVFILNIVVWSYCEAYCRFDQSICYFINFRQEPDNLIELVTQLTINYHIINLISILQIESAYDEM